MQNDELGHLSGESWLPQHELTKELKEKFPGTFSENKVDCKKLKQELGEEFDDAPERYGLSWAGKQNVFNVIQEPTTKTLKVDRDESVDFDTSQNLFIEGDNLEVLKVLQRSYYGKIKMIYIDPPYNTGKDFIYSDKWQQSRGEYEQEAGIRNADGNVHEVSGLRQNTRDSGHFHSNWLNMMYPRLYLARNLLRQDGVIFVSIDDNEVHNLRMIMNEIFGEENFIDCLVWKKRYGGGSKEKYFVTVHEYILVYARDLNNILDIEVPLSQESIDRYYTEKDDQFEKRGPFRTHPLEATRSMGDRPNLIFPIKAPDGTNILPERQWLWSKERVAEAQDGGEIKFYKAQGVWKVSTKQYLKDANGNLRNGKMQSLIDGIYGQYGTNEIIELMQNAQVFPFSKPTKLIEGLLSASSSSNDMILDFFAGSGSAAHAAEQLNARDGGNRKWIAVQLAEEVDDTSEAKKAGFKNIAQLSRERIRRAGKKIRGNYKDNIKKRKTPIDLGFKALKLEETNFKIWDSSVRDKKQLEHQMKAMLNVIRDDADEGDLLLELMLKSGIEPTEKQEKVETESGEFYRIGLGELIICLADKVSEKLFSDIVNQKPSKVIFLERALLQNDVLKSNVLLSAEKLNLEIRIV